VLGVGDADTALPADDHAVRHVHPLGQRTLHQTCRLTMGAHLAAEHVRLRMRVDSAHESNDKASLDHAAFSRTEDCLMIHESGIVIHESNCYLHHTGVRARCSDTSGSKPMDDGTSTTPPSTECRQGAHSPRFAGIPSSLKPSAAT